MITVASRATGMAQARPNRRVIATAAMLPTRKGNTPIDTSEDGDWASNAAPKTRGAKRRRRPNMAREYMPACRRGDAAMAIGG